MAVAMRRHVHRHAGDRRGEVSAVIEIEAAQVVLVRLALAAVLTDHDTRHRLEDFAGAHDRARVELACRDGALAGGLRDPDQVLRRRRCIGEVGEGRLARHRDVGAEDEVHDRVDCCLVHSDHDRPPDRGEVDERERDLELPGRDPVDSIPPAFVGLRLTHGRRARPQLDPDTGERRARLVQHGAPQLRLLCRHRDGGEEHECGRAQDRRNEESWPVHVHGGYSRRTSLRGADAIGCQAVPEVAEAGAAGAGARAAVRVRMENCPPRSARSLGRLPAKFRRRGTEVVVTGAPRKRVVRKGTWVRIPPSPPSTAARR